MDAYERSLKQQADRIRRELSQEGRKGAPVPKPEPKDEFIPSDVPSPIYGYARPKPKINLPVDHSPETRDDLSIRQAQRVSQSAQSATVDALTPTPIQPESEEGVVAEQTAVKVEAVNTSGETSVNQVDLNAIDDQKMVAEQMEISSEKTVISTETIEEIPGSREDEMAESETKPILGEVSILENGFASVFMGSTDLKSSKITVREEKQDVNEVDMPIHTSIEETAPIVEDVAKTLQTDVPHEVLDEEELTPGMSVSYKAEGPPLNVMMTPQDRMAMYKSRRLAKKNNNL